MWTGTFAFIVPEFVGGNPEGHTPIKMLAPWRIDR